MSNKCVCCICGKGPAPSDGGVTVYRINAKGVPGIWACERHLKNTDANVDPETLRISKALSGQ